MQQTPMVCDFRFTAQGTSVPALWSQTFNTQSSAPEYRTFPFQASNEHIQTSASWAAQVMSWRRPVSVSFRRDSVPPDVLHARSLLGSALDLPQSTDRHIPSFRQMLSARAIPSSLPSECCKTPTAPSAPAQAMMGAEVLRRLFLHRMSKIPEPFL